MSEETNYMTNAFSVAAASVRSRDALKKPAKQWNA